MSTTYYPCVCKCGVLCFQYDAEVGLEVSMFSCHPLRSLSNKIRLAWGALRGRPYTDMVILNNQQIADIVDQLTCIQQRSDYNL